MGNLSRSSGKRGELEAAKLLDPLVDGADVVTTRSVTGGYQHGLDLCARDHKTGAIDSLIAGWGVEVKYLAAFPTAGTWLKYVTKAAADTPPPGRPVVLFRAKGSPQWWAGLAIFDEVEVDRDDAGNLATVTSVGAFVVTPFEAWRDRLFLPHDRYLLGARP